MTPPSAIIEALKRVEPDADGFHSVGGSHYQSTPSHKSYFAKEGSPSEAEQYHGEAESLSAMYAASPGICPKVFECALDDSSKRPVFVSEYKKIGPFSQRSAAALGTKLAEMHTRGTSPTGRFGFAVPTYCGATRMENGWFDTWAAAYDQKIGSLLDHLRSRGGYQKTCELGEEVRARVIPRLLGPSLRIQPALLHGDLWNGNAGTDTDTGQPVIFDPSSYYGHNEAELSIARIFGGFPQAFFTAYHENIPPTEPVGEYDQRGALYELFHYLNHTVLFGRSYESSAKQRMIQLLQYVRENEQTSSL